MNKKISKELLAKAMGGIDDRFIDDAHRGSGAQTAGAGYSGGKKRSSFSWKWVTAAAAVLVFIVAGTVIMIKTAGSRLNMRNGSEESDSMYAPGAIMHNGQKSDAVSPGITSDSEYGGNLPVNSLPSGNGPTEAAIAPDSLNVYYWYDGGNEGNQVYACVKIPNDWIIDAVEVFAAGYQDKCVKRLTSDIDAGYVWLTNYQGHSLYRNVDQEFTEERSENAGKLVYNYSLGVNGSTDPSGIDAEASIRNGAHIVYLDTNNSTEDFHERQRFSIK